jgi:hypothetical protein
MDHSLIMKNILHIITCVWILILTSCGVDERKIYSKSMKGQVINVGQKLVFSNEFYKGSIEAPDEARRFIILNGNKYNISVRKRSIPVGEDINFEARYGVYNPGESFAPHLGVQIAYNESVQGFKNVDFGKADLKAGLTSMKNTEGFFLSNDGLYLKIGGSHDAGRLTFTVEKMMACEKAVSIPSLPSQGFLKLEYIE